MISGGSKKILLLSNMYPSEDTPSYGIFVKNIYEMLKSEGFDISKVVITGKSRNKLKKLIRYLLFFLKVVVVLSFSRRKVYIHYVAHTSLPVLLVSAFRKLQIYAHVHGGDIRSDDGTNSLLRYFKNKLSGHLLSKSKVVVVPSSHFKSIVQRDFKIEDKRIHVSPSGGIDTDIFNCQSLKRRTESSIRHKPRFGYVGRLDHGKGVDTLLKACNLLEQHGKRFSLDIVGSGSCKVALESQCLELRLFSEVNFVGEVDQMQLPEIYRSFDFLIFPSEREGESLGLVGLEAMACGVPVICSNLPGPAEYLIDGENGFFFEPSEERSLFKQLLKVYNLSNKQLEQISESSVKTSFSFSKKRVLSELTSLFID